MYSMYVLEQHLQAHMDMRYDINEHVGTLKPVLNVCRAQQRCIGLIPIVMYLDPYSNVP